MLSFLTSLSFLYIVTIVLLVLFVWIYYQRFSRYGTPPKGFPLVFLLIAVGCLGFLWANFHPPLTLKTFSNLDHHFLKLDGFAVNRGIRLGGTDTVSYPKSSTNEFNLNWREGQLRLVAPYSEDPLYLDEGKGYQLQSRQYPALAHTLTLGINAVSIRVHARDDNQIELSVGDQTIRQQKEIRQGISIWNLFKEQPAFQQTEVFSSPQWSFLLQKLFLLRPSPASDDPGELVYFISGRVFPGRGSVYYDDKPVGPQDLAFSVVLPDHSLIAWGTGLLSANRNQFRISIQGGDRFDLLPRYPQSYPMTEEDGQDWTSHEVRKFLVATTNDLVSMAPVFREGFQFSFPGWDSLTAFEPTILTYYKDRSGHSLRFAAQQLSGRGDSIPLEKGQFFLPAISGDFRWIFSVADTMQWHFTGGDLPLMPWAGWIFGALIFYVLLIAGTALVSRRGRLSSVWQVLSALILVLLTTRFFLYWRYKTFPPFEGLDLPSQQQLGSISNFLIIVVATVVLALVLGFGCLRWIWARLSGRMGVRLTRQDDEAPFSVQVLSRLEKFSAHSQTTTHRRKIFFLGSWLLLLTLGGLFAYLSHFDPGHCRHLAIGLTVAYFLFSYISYRHSPLVKAREESWWRIDSTRPFQLLISNPPRILLATSLLALFVFIDIGFAIVFLNFLLFNEAFLNLNYAVAGLSSGSRSNARLFGTAALVYLGAFVVNLLYAPYIFQFLLNQAQGVYLAGYFVFALLMAYTLMRIFPGRPGPRRKWLAAAAVCIIFSLAFLFLPKEKVLNKAAVTRYRIDVLTMPVDQAIGKAYRDGKNYDPVIRAAQNQWFINTLIDEDNNPMVNQPVFHLLPHAPQNKGAKYNAQATDLVASRYLLAEHGKWAILLLVVLLLLPAVLLSSFYKLYPDFSNRVNQQYAIVTVGFSILNYAIIAALLVVLAATGRYIFFGQDLPFASILSKQSILFPSLLLVIAVLLFGSLAQEYYASRKKLLPALVVCGMLTVMLFLVRPSFNRNREFNTGELAGNLDDFARERLQPVLNYFDTAYRTRRLPLAKKDRLFCDSIRKQINAGVWPDAGGFFTSEVNQFIRADLSQHLDPARMLYIDNYSGSLQLAVNENFFRVDPPPHLQQLWKGNVTADSSVYNFWLWQAGARELHSTRVQSYSDQPAQLAQGRLRLHLVTGKPGVPPLLYLINGTGSRLTIREKNAGRDLNSGDSILVRNPVQWMIEGLEPSGPSLLVVEPDAFMRNYFVNGGRQYVYPLRDRFIWARNFAESIASGYVASNRTKQNAVVSLDYSLMDSLTTAIRSMLADTAYNEGAEYGITVVDGQGRLLAMADGVKSLVRPDPNDRSSFNRAGSGQDGVVSQAALRKQLGNLNLLRLNPGPGSTFKPVVFAAIASQLKLDWDQFAAEGFTGKQKYYGGERVPEYDFEKNNGRINNVIDYLRYSDNYYHSNVLLLGSYTRQPLDRLLNSHFQTSKTDTGFHWPYFDYAGKRYWMDGFRNWPGYEKGKADFGSDSSFTSVGLFSNFGIATRPGKQSSEMFQHSYDSLLFAGGYRKSGFLLPEFGLFDQSGSFVDHRIPYDLFTSSFRGHVKGSSQVMVAPVKMAEAFGKLASQNSNFRLTLNPYAVGPTFAPFVIDRSIGYAEYLSVIREMLFAGMRETLRTGTAAQLGVELGNGNKYFYYAKTGTTGDDEKKTKSKLLALVISKKDIADPGFGFRNNKFCVVYFTLQNGPAIQNERFQKQMIRMIEASPVFRRYMGE